jgi:pimeloyl-ACP methyl ester carboxylesterase
MGKWINLDGIATWYGEYGKGESLVLFHPGGVDARALRPSPMNALKRRFHVFTPERRGHGHTPDASGPYSFEQFADDAAAFIERVVKAPAHLVGISDGAVVALLVAQRRPDLARKLAIVSGPFHVDGWLPEAIDPSNEPPEFMANMYAELSPDGADHYKVVCKKLAQMHLEGPKLTPAMLARVKARTLMMLGDDDEVILEHAISLYRSVPDAELAVLPGTSHGLMVEKPKLFDSVIMQFLTEDAVRTLAPVRRRTKK